MIQNAVKDHGSAELTPEVRKITIDMLADELKHLPNRRNLDGPIIPEFRYLGNGSPTHVQCILKVDGTAPFTRTAQGTDAKAMAEAYMWALINMYAHGDTNRSFGV